jgi:hypothetical protein
VSDEYLTARAACGCGGRPWEVGLPRVLSWECGHCGGRRMVKPSEVPLVADLEAERDALAAEVARLRAVERHGGRLAERINARLTEEVLRLTAERDALLAAVRRHRDYRGDDRCYMDDEELYRALPEGYTPPAREVAVELENCRRYLECRRNPATEYVSPQREIERLAAENDALRAEVARLSRVVAEAEGEG